jgi:hypothetical protein
MQIGSKVDVLTQSDEPAGQCDTVQPGTQFLTEFPPNLRGRVDHAVEATVVM